MILATIGGEYEKDHVVEVGYDLATAYEDELVVLHVMTNSQYEELRGKDEIRSPVTVPGAGDSSGFTYVDSARSQRNYTIEDGMSDAEDVARKCVSRTLPDDLQTTVTTEGRVGDPATEIVEEADRIAARYVVVGGRRRSPVGKAMFGSVSQSVILNSERPVVAITREK